MAEKKNLPSVIAVFTLIIVIIGVISAAAVTNKSEVKPAANENIKSFSMGIGQEYAYPKGDRKMVRLKSADKKIVDVYKDGILKAVAEGSTMITANGEKICLHRLKLLFRLKIFRSASAKPLRLKQICLICRIWRVLIMKLLMKISLHIKMV